MGAVDCDIPLKVQQNEEGGDGGKGLKSAHSISFGKTGRDIAIRIPRHGNKLLFDINRLQRRTETRWEFNHDKMS
jgi:hypothetical protein